MFHGGKERGHAGPSFLFSFRRRASGRAAVACDLRRYTLQDAALRRRTGENAVIAVGMDVDKPRREVMILRVDGLPRFALKLPDRGDPPALYRNVRPVPRRTCSVHDSCIPNDQIIHMGFLLFILLTSFVSVSGYRIYNNVYLAVYAITVFAGKQDCAALISILSRIFTKCVI